MVAYHRWSLEVKVVGVVLEVVLDVMVEVEEVLVIKERSEEDFKKK